MQFACRDMGLQCDFVANGKSIEDVKKEVLTHTKSAHEDLLKTYSTPEKMQAMERQIEKLIC